jgi:hypothetical protein|eukprot:Transcript_17976.p1 GENE.Transcript_17976~~Transcript_17976.p1  ORF type:complete len:244 (-),score=69.18 Transcript_17976:52-783(-)
MNHGHRLILLALPAALCYTPTSLRVPPRAAAQLRARCSARLGPDFEVSDDIPFDATTSGAATGATISDADKTDGIPNYMLRTSGTVVRLAEGPGSSTAVEDNGVLYEADRLVSIVTSDVIDMVQQQGGSAEKVDYLGENLLVSGLLFDDFKAEDTFEIGSAEDSAEADVVKLEIIEARPASALELGQCDDAAKKQSIATMMAMAPGFSGWSAKVLEAGRVRTGFKIARAGRTYVSEVPEGVSE